MSKLRRPILKSLEKQQNIQSNLNNIENEQPIIQINDVEKINVQEEQPIIQINDVEEIATQKEQISDKSIQQEDNFEETSPFIYIVIFLIGIAVIFLGGGLAPLGFLMSAISITTGLICCRKSFIVKFLFSISIIAFVLFFAFIILTLVMCGEVISSCN